MISLEYVEHVVSIVLIYATAGFGLRLLVGGLGVFALSQSLMIGVGAYASAILTTQLSQSWVTGLLAGLLISGVLSTLIAVLTSRMRDDALILATLSIQIVGVGILANWTAVTAGPLGIREIPRPEFFGIGLVPGWRFLALASALAALVYFTVDHLSTAQLGRILVAARDNERVAWSFGKHVGRIRAMATIVAASAGSIAGCLYAHYVRSIDPSVFSPTESLSDCDEITGTNIGLSP